MLEGAYELGVDIGSSSVVAVITRSDPEGAGSSPVAFRTDLTTAVAAWSAGRELDEPSGAELFGLPADLLARVGDPTPLRVGQRTATSADVVAGLVRLLVDRATAQEGRAPAGTAVVVPPSWGGHRRGALVAALQAAGVVDAVPVSAAVAAVRAHVAGGDLPATATAVVVDLGAATSDVAVVGPREDGALDHRATPPAALSWGGRDVDDAVLRHVRRSLELPTALPTPADRTRAVALRTACTTAKEAASLQTEVAVTVDPVWSDVAVRLTREELEGAVEDDVERVVASAVDAVAAAGGTPDELTAVVLTGGASRMPLVAERLSAALAVRLCTTADPSLTSALGAARMAADLCPASEEIADAEGGTATESLPSLRRPTGRHRDTRSATRPAGISRGPGRTGRPAPREGISRPPSSRVAVVAALFLLLVVGPSVVLTLAGVSPGGVAADGTAAAGDQTASAPTSSGDGAAALPGTSVGGAAATSNADHRVVAPSTSSSSEHAAGTSTSARAGSTQNAPSAVRSSTAATSSATAAAATAATPVTTTGTGSTTPGTTTSADPPTSTAPEPPPVTSSAPEPPPTSTAPEPPPATSSVPEPPPVTSSPADAGSSSSADSPTASGTAGATA